MLEGAYVVVCQVPWHLRVVSISAGRKVCTLSYMSRLQPLTLLSYGFLGACQGVCEEFAVVSVLIPCDSST